MGMQGCITGYKPEIEPQPHPVLFIWYEWYVACGEIRVPYSVSNYGSADMEWGDLYWMYKTKKDNVETYVSHLDFLPIGSTFNDTLHIPIQVKVVDFWYDHCYFEPWPN
jgi:hypothetical protein